MRDPQTSPPLPEQARLGLPELDPEGRPWSQLTFLILRHRRGEITLDEMMREAMPVIRRVARYAGSVRRLSEEAEEIAQELAILLCTNLYREFDPLRADAMSMLTTYARSVARTEERRADRRPLSIDPADARMPHDRNPHDYVTGLGGTGAAREGDDDPYFARLDQSLAQRRIAAALSTGAPPAADRLASTRSNGHGTARDGAGHASDQMTHRTTHVNGVLAQLPEVPISLGAVEVIQRRGVPAALQFKGPGELVNKELYRHRSTRPVSPEQQLLRETRRKLGYTSQEFARLLRIGAPRLASYEYGVTAGVPDDVMRRLHEVARSHADKAATLSLFRRKLIGSIVSEWEQQLRPFVRKAHGGAARSSEPLSLRELALELQVNVVTLKRWAENHTRPAETRIAAVDEHVKKRLSHYKARQLKKRLSNRS
jgi:DNA-binding transcriptional regulator YiaG